METQLIMIVHIKKKCCLLFNFSLVGCKREISNSYGWR